MAVTGGIKFFDGIKNLADDGAFIVASSGTAREDYVIGRNPLLLWKSDTGSDVTTETLTLTLPSATAITRIFLVNHNFKGFTIKYDTDDSGSFSDFTSVVGINGTTYVGGIVETAFAYSTAYYEFASVSAKRIQITCTTTQVADAKKFLGQIIATTELGTLSGYPTVRPGVDRNKRVSKMLSGRSSLTRGIDVFSGSLRFANYPTASEYQTDVSLAVQLHNRDTPFLIWLCGGRTGSTFFKHTTPGFRLQDVFLVNVVNDIDVIYQKNIYINGVDFELKMEDAA